INNEWVNSKSGDTIETYNPATGEVIATVEAGGAADIDRAVQAAKAAFENGPWGTMDAADRGRLMYRLADLIEQNAPRLAALEAYNAGKTITDCGGDLQGVVNCLR